MKLQDYDFTLYYIPGKMNTKANILLRKDQVDTKEDNKDILMLQEEMTRRQIMAEVTLIIKNQVVEETILLGKIWRNNIK